MPKRLGSAPHLTDREIECMTLVVAGLTEPEISDRLGVSRSTVHFHVENVKKKLNARTRARAAAVLVGLGQVSVAWP